MNKMGFKMNYWLYYYFFQIAIGKNDLLGKICLLGARHYEGSQPLTGLMPILQEKTDALYCKPAQEPVAREVIVPKR